MCVPFLPSSPLTASAAHPTFSLDAGNDTGPATESWIQCSGPLSLRSGLGEYGTATPGSVLRKFSEHLEDLPWGLSRKYRAVLLQLSQEDEL